VGPHQHDYLTHNLPKESSSIDLIDDKLMINIKFQLHLILQITILGILVALLSAALILYLKVDLLITAAVCLPVTMLGGFLISMHISWPVKKLQNALEKQAKGEQAPPLKFRRDDPFQELAHAFNKQRIFVNKLQNDQNISYKKAA